MKSHLPSSPANGSAWLFYGGLVVMVAALAAFVGYAATIVRPADVDLIIKTKQEAAEIKKALDTVVVGRTPEGFHRKDMREWCEAFERANKGSGIICPDPYDLPGYRHPR